MSRDDWYPLKLEREVPGRLLVSLDNEISYRNELYHTRLCRKLYRDYRKGEGRRMYMVVLETKM